MHDLSLGFVLSLGLHSSLKPGVLEGLSSADTFIGRAEHVADQVFSFIGDSFPWSSFQFVVAIFDGSSNFAARCSIEWGLTAQQDVQENSNSPNIGTVVVTSFESLRGDIVRRAVDTMQELILGHSSAGPEVNHFDNIVFNSVEVDVGWLYVTMHNALRV
jgi:hypothetical protein